MKCILGLMMVALANPQSYKVTPRVMVEKPVSPLLASHFVELGYGYQVEPMMAEMLFNRSFEPYMPYRDNSFTWFGLWFDSKDYSKGYETDWRRMHWYHSGYEHNAWFAAPAEEPPFHIDQQATFFVTGNRIELTRDKADVRHGRQALRLHNRDAREWVALAQAGKYLRKGETYTFRGLLKSGGGPARAEVRFYPRGRWDGPIAVLPLKDLGPQYAEKSVSFRNPGYQGYATFSLWIPPGASITVDDFSLLPESSFDGWRNDVIEAIKQLKPGLFRFPGGCFASFYDWRDGVGPLSRRPPEASYFWGGMNYNDLGTDEFAAMAKRVGAEMMFAVNVFHPGKRDYLLTTPNRPPATSTHSFDMSRFTDLEKGAKLAADWVAYCNLPAGRHPMADLRARNGYKKPWGVKYWELDNETTRWFEPAEYARAAVLYSKAMKAVDPSIKTGIVAYGWRKEQALSTLLEGAGREIDFLADRNDAEGGLDAVLALIRRFNAANGTRLFYANTEWLPRDTRDRMNAFNVVRTANRGEFFDRMSRWNLGMAVVKNMMSWQRRGGDVAWVNFNNLANTHAQSAIETPKENAFLTACGVALSMIAHSPAAWPLEIEGYRAKVDDEFQVQAAWDLERKRLVLYVVNRTAARREVVFDLGTLGREFREAAITTAGATGPTVKNTPAEPEGIWRRSRREKVPNLRGAWRVAAEPWTFTEAVLR